jgi:DNA-binding NtrC family response regulator
MSHRILIIEDEPRMRRVLQLLLEDKGYDVRTAGDGVEGMGLWQKLTPHVVLTDVRLPGADGMKILGFKNEKRLRAPLIMLTAFGNIEMAVEAMKQGAFDYITKPFDNERVVETVRRAVEEQSGLQGFEIGDGHGGKEAERRMVGSSQVMQEIWKDIHLVSRSRTSVLITGESGAGKELVARAIHEKGDRRRKRFVKVNCSAIPRDLLESELFGHRKGAFTGAISDREGSFITADGGTIFLDEVGDLPFALQPKLLHAVEEKTITPIGGTRTVRVDVKVVSATNRDIDRMVAEGLFREDLFFRLNAFRIHVPPLRERIEDLEDLVPHFLDRFSREFGKGGLNVGSDLLSTLMAYQWPGNVRELRNVMERAVLSCHGGAVGIRDLPDRLRREGDPHRADANPPQLDLEAQERLLIEKALDKTGRNQTRAAKLLNISRNTLRYRMKKHGLSD